MQWCQRLEADYGMDPRICQSLDGPSFRHSSKLCPAVRYLNNFETEDTGDYTFADSVQAGIYPGFCINFAGLDI